MAGGIAYTNKYSALSRALLGGSQALSNYRTTMQADEDRKRKLLKEEEDKANREALAGEFESQGTPEAKILGGMARTGDVGSAGNLYGISQSNQNLKDKEQRKLDQEALDQEKNSGTMDNLLDRYKTDKRYKGLMDSPTGAAIEDLVNASKENGDFKTGVQNMRALVQNWATTEAQNKRAEASLSLAKDKGETMDKRLDLSYRKDFENSQPIKSLLNVANPLAKVTYAENRFNEISKDPKANMEKISAARNNADQLLVVAYTKLGDETSVVMPSEFERYFQGSSLFQKMKNLASQGFKGGLKISNADREEIKRTISGTMDIYKENAKEDYEQAKLDEADLGARPGFITGKIDKYMKENPAVNPGKAEPDTIKTENKVASGLTPEQRQKRIAELKAKMESN